MAIKLIHGHKSICIFSGEQLVGNVQIIETPLTLEPHVVWTAAATKRSIYQGTFAVIQHLCKIKHVVIVTCQQYQAWFNSLCKRGLLTFIGSFQGMDIIIYQAVKA